MYKPYVKHRIMKELITKWQDYLGLLDWTIITKRIDPNQVMYNGETYFIGISTDPDDLSGTIYHDDKYFCCDSCLIIGSINFSMFCYIQKI